MRYRTLTLGAAVLFALAGSTAGQTCDDNPVFQVHNENITKTIEQAKNYTPGSRAYYVQDFNDNENIYLKAALSPAQRKEYIGRWQDAALAKCLDNRLNELEAVAAQTIGGYKPTGYTLGTPAEKNVLKGAVNDIAKATVFNVGLKSPTWKIVKDDIGLPRERVRYGTIWAKYPDEKYCTIIYVNLVQDYAGGGTYNSSEGRFINTEFAGCPAK
jgi:hypothetical protein